MSHTVDSVLDRAVAHHRAGEFAQAESLYREALQLSPANPRALHLLGVLVFQAGQYAAAVGLFDRAIQANPQFAATYFYRGNALYLLGQFRQAVESYNRAIATNPRHAEACNNRGNALHALGEFERAVGSYDQAIALKPDYAEAHNNRANSLHALHQHPAALQSSDRALQINPGYVEAHFSRANELHELHQYQAAVQSYDQAIALRPGYAEAHNNRGRALHSLGEYQAAVQSYDQAIALRPGYAEAHNNRGSALYSLEQYQAAVQSYDQAIALRPGYGEALSNRGIAMQQWGFQHPPAATVTPAEVRHNSSPKISVIVVTNRKGFEPVLLDDLSRQSFRSFEVIVADENFNGEARFDKHFKPRPKAEGDAWNLNKAYNDAIAKAEGELLVFLQDFIWIPDTGLQRFWDDYQQHPNAFVTGAGHKAQDGLKGISELDIRLNEFQSFQECPFYCWEMNWASAPKALFPWFDERMDSYYGGENHFVAKFAQKFGATIMIDPLNRCVGYSQQHCGGRPADWEIRHANKQGRLEAFLESIDHLERW